MLIRTMKEFDSEKIPSTEVCVVCQKPLLVPSIIVIHSPIRQRYHFKCARNLAYMLLFAMTGEPHIETVGEAGNEAE